MAYFNLALKNLQNRLRAFKPVLNERFLQLILDNEDSIIQLITEDQLFGRGEDGRGISLGSYKPGTIRYKKRKNQPTDRVTLKDKGNFYKSLKVVLTKDEGFYVESDFARSGDASDYFYGKRDYLLGKYPYALRLSDENLKALIATIIKPKVIEWMRSYLLEERLQTGDTSKLDKFNKKYPKRVKMMSNRRTL